MQRQKRVKKEYTKKFYTGLTIVITGIVFVNSVNAAIGTAFITIGAVIMVKSK